MIRKLQLTAVAGGTATITATITAITPYDPYLYYPYPYYYPYASRAASRPGMAGFAGRAVLRCR